MADARRVLVTRSEPGASETARRLEAMGFLPVKLPLHAIKPLLLNAAVVPKKVVAVAVTSTNAIRYAPPALLAKLAGLPCFVVGTSSAGAATEAGFSSVIEGGGDAEALAETIIRQRPGGTLAYLCGKVRRPTFEKRLADKDITIHAIETYDTVAFSYTTEDIINLTARRPVDHILIYSANTAEALAATIRQPELENLFENTIFACISGRVAEVLDGWPRSRILVAPEPNETALLSLLRPSPGKAP